MVTIQITKNFKSAAKPLLKKYPSLSKDLLNLERELINNPKLGTPLGHNAYKIRIKITSKGKGKSGGARVISLVETTIIGTVDIQDENVIVNLISIYDKADTATISDKELKDLIKSFHQGPDTGA
jgi:mRNA-degrading endonuclease RelE of RelBE toxin-antitoxin system